MTWSRLLLRESSDWEPQNSCKSPRNPRLLLGSCTRPPSVTNGSLSNACEALLRKIKGHLFTLTGVHLSDNAYLLTHLK